MKEKLKKLWLLFTTTFTVSITANSGYAIVAVLRTKFVEKLKWISEDEMATYVALTQSIPGPVAVNCSRPPARTSPRWPTRWASPPPATSPNVTKTSLAPCQAKEGSYQLLAAKILF